MQPENKLKQILNIIKGYTLKEIIEISLKYALIVVLGIIITKLIIKLLFEVIFKW